MHSHNSVSSQVPAKLAKENQEPPRPSWWTGYHASRWERVKESFRLAWELAKSELIKVEAARIARKPHPEEKDPELAKGEGRAQTQPQVASPPAEKATKKGEGEPSQVTEVTGAKAPMSHARGDAAAWEQAESEGSYGFSARSQFPQFDDWGDDLETTLRIEWEKMHPARPFEDARKGIRQGWEFSRPHNN